MEETKVWDIMSGLTVVCSKSFYGERFSDVDLTLGACKASRPW